MVPDNFFGSASSNRNMLQIVFFSLLAGIALVQVREEKRRPVFEVISGLQELVIRSRSSSCSLRQSVYSR